jgi:hypothetical protein
MINPTSHLMSSVSSIEVEAVEFTTELPINKQIALDKCVMRDA